MEYELIRSMRKSISIQIKSDATVVVRAPFEVSQREIERFLMEKARWIRHNQELMRARKEVQPVENAAPMTKEEVLSLVKEAMEYIPKRVQYYAPMLGVTYGRITIRNQKTRWGSCSSKGGLNFNCLLMKAPPEVIDYVVVHELCHRIEMNHSKRFWTLVEGILPDYKERRKWLKEYGGALMESMFGSEEV